MSERSANVVILDRDGTIVIDRHYLGDPVGLEFLRGAEEGLRRLQELGCRLIVVTNQSGVGRGILSLHQVEQVNERLRQMLARAGVELEAIYFCPHAPAEKCKCRKPEIGLAQRAARDFNFDLTSAIVIGDKSSDVEFGRRMGALTMLIGAQVSESIPEDRPDFIIEDLKDAARIVKSLSSV